MLFDCSKGWPWVDWVPLEWINCGKRFSSWGWWDWLRSSTTTFSGLLGVLEPGIKVGAADCGRYFGIGSPSRKQSSLCHRGVFDKFDLWEGPMISWILCRLEVKRVVIIQVAAQAKQEQYVSSKSYALKLQLNRSIVQTQQHYPSASMHATCPSKW